MEINYLVLRKELEIKFGDTLFEIKTQNLSRDGIQLAVIVKACRMSLVEDTVVDDHLIARFISGRGL